MTKLINELEIICYYIYKDIFLKKQNSKFLDKSITIFELLYHQISHYCISFPYSIKAYKLIKKYGGENYA